MAKEKIVLILVCVEDSVGEYNTQLPIYQQNIAHREHVCPQKVYLPTPLQR